tara:strand:+ start:273 stop:1052 length:780 start_codon:yes stop_codon:yes gene_type:complete
MKQLENIIIPMGGLGKRFKKYKFNTIKPLIQIDDKCILEKSMMYLPKAKNMYFVIKKNIFKKSRVLKKIAKEKNVKFFFLNSNTLGQADTISQVQKKLPINEESIIHSCDYILKFNIDYFIKLKKKCDVIIFSTKLKSQIVNNYSDYAYCKIKNKDNVIKIVEKRTISNNPANDYAVTGTFWFNKISDCIKSQEISLKRKNLVNNEYYIANNINNLINNGLKVKIMPVNYWINLGDYFGLQEYIYWKNFFIKNTELRRC